MDGIELNAGSGGSVISTDDIASVHYQIVKLALGALDSATLATGGNGNTDAGTLRVTIAADTTGVLSVDDNGSTLSIDDGGGAITVDGTVAVTGTVDLGATDNAVLDAIAASVAAIDTDATTIIGHVDGIETLLGTIDADTSGIITAVELIDDAVYVDDADWTDSTSKHVLTGGLYQSTPQTVTDGDVAPFNITANGALHVAQQGTVTVDLGANNDVTVTGTVDLGATDNAVLDAIAASVAAIDTDATTIIGHVDGIEGLLTTIDGDTGVLAGLVLATQADDVANTADGLQTTAFGYVFDGTTWDRARGDATNGTLVNLGSNNDVTVTGTVDLGATDNAVLDAIAASLALLDNSISAGNELQVDVVAALPAGTNNIGDVDVLSIAAGTNTIGNVGLVGRTTGGMSAFNSIDLDETEEDIKTSAGQVFSISAFNTTAAPLWLRFYNATAANTTVGTTAAHLGPFMVPANADSDGAGFVWNNPIGVAFGTAICAAVTTGVAANDTGAPGANACVVVVGYV